MEKFLNEKRRHPRVALGLKMNIGNRRGSITDLSQGGMTFKTNAELAEGMSLCLTLGKPNIPLEIRGEVRHAGASSGGVHCYGVRFHKIGFKEIQ